MKKFLFSFFIFFSLIVKAQNVSQSSYNENNTSGFGSINDAKSIISNIISVVGLKPKFEIREAAIPNAAAVIYAGKRFILYNPSFVAALNKTAGNQWASVSILAHEIGHHLNGHTLESGGSSPEIELEADEFSGFVLKKMGATLQEAQLAMKIAASQKASHSHPAQADRLTAIAKGYNAADKQVSGKNDMASAYKKPAPSQPVVNQTRTEVVKTEVAGNNQTAIAEKYIYRDVHFYNDQASKYYVTIRSNLVKAQGSNLSLLGKLVASDSEQFPLIIVADKAYLLISKSGSIINTAGQKVGYISEHNN